MTTLGSGFSLVGYASIAKATHQEVCPTQSGSALCPTVWMVGLGWVACLVTMLPAALVGSLLLPVPYPVPTTIVLIFPYLQTIAAWHLGLGNIGYVVCLLSLRGTEGILLRTSGCAAACFFCVQTVQ